MTRAQSAEGARTGITKARDGVVHGRVHDEIALFAVPPDAFVCHVLLPYARQEAAKKRRTRKGVAVAAKAAVTVTGDLPQKPKKCFGVFCCDHAECRAMYWDQDVNAAINMLALLKSELFAFDRISIATIMSDSPWNVAPVPGIEPTHAPKPVAPIQHAKKEEHVVWNAAPKPKASTTEKIKDKTRHVVEDAKDITAKVASTVEGYKNDSVAKVKKIKEERKVAKEEKKGDKKKAEESAGACGICGCTVM